MKADVLNQLVDAAQMARRALHDLNALHGTSRHLGDGTPAGNAVLAERGLETALAAVETAARTQKRSSPDFDGETYDPALDKERLKRQLGRVFSVMMDGQWKTLEEIARRADAPEASVSARLRDLKKKNRGGYIMERRRCERASGLFEYRLLSPSGAHIGKSAQVELL